MEHPSTPHIAPSKSQCSWQNPLEELPPQIPSNRLPHPLRQLLLPKLPHVQEALLAQIDILDIRHVLRRGLADSTGNNHGVRLEDDAVVDDFVDGEGDKVVVFDDGAFVGGIPAVGLACTHQTAHPPKKRVRSGSPVWTSTGTADDAKRTSAVYSDYPAAPAPH